MSIANDIIFLSLRNAGVNGVGQTPSADDVNDTFRVLNAWIAEINIERSVMVNPEVLPTFPDLTTDVPFWTQYEHVLLTSMAVRLRQIYALPPVQLDVQIAVSALAAFNAINLQQQSPPVIAADDSTGYGLVYLALRAAGRVTDKQGVLQTSQDVSDGASLMNEMLDEWQRERTVRVIPGTLAPISDLSAAVTMTSGEKNAVVLGLGVRLRDWFGQEPNPALIERAQRALSLLQAINLQQQPAPVIAGDDGTGYGLLYLALRGAGRVTDQQGVAQSSQDISDAHSLLNEMLDEWQQERTVRVIPGTLPTITDLTAPVSLPPGLRSAIVLNLTVRLRDAFGSEVSPSLLERATKAIALVQAINQQQTPATHGGVPSTVIQLLFLALRMAGRISDEQSVADGSKDVSDAFALLTLMLSQWQRKRWVTWAESEVYCTATGNYSYTIGPSIGCDFNAPRPDKIHAAYVRLTPGDFDGSALAAMLPFPLGGSPVTNPIDLPLQIIESHEDWATITIKDLVSLPAAVFYDSQWPTGRVHFWPMPPAGTYSLHLVVKTALPVYATTDDVLNVPPEYLDAMLNNLAVRIGVASGAPVNPLLVSEARASLNLIKLTNSQIPQLSMPAPLSGRRSTDASSWAGRGLSSAWTVGGPSVLG